VILGVVGNQIGRISGAEFGSLAIHQGGYIGSAPTVPAHQLVLPDFPNLSSLGTPLLLELGSLIDLRLGRREFSAPKVFEQGLEFVFIPELCEVHVE
jgi:hypothetical protein